MTADIRGPDDAPPVDAPPHSPAESADPDAPTASEFELLFCANCTVSVPQTHVVSGAAGPGGGGVLCAVCLPAEPAERAKIRADVAAEMAEAEGPPPVPENHCSLCRALVAEGHLRTGRATLRDGKIVCRRCATRQPPSDPGKSGRTTPTRRTAPASAPRGRLPADDEPEPAPIPGMVAPRAAQPNQSAELTRLVANLNQRVGGLERRIFRAERELAGSGQTVAADDSSSVAALAARLVVCEEQLATEVGALREELAHVEREAATRVARLEGSLETLSSQISALLVIGKGADITEGDPL